MTAHDSPTRLVFSPWRHGNSPCSRCQCTVPTLSASPAKGARSQHRWTHINLHLICPSHCSWRHSPCLAVTSKRRQRHALETCTDPSRRSPQAGPFVPRRAVCTPLGPATAAPDASARTIPEVQPDLLAVLDSQGNGGGRRRSDGDVGQQPRGNQGRAWAGEASGGSACWPTAGAGWCGGCPRLPGRQSLTFAAFGETRRCRCLVASPQ